MLTEESLYVPFAPRNEKQFHQNMIGKCIVQFVKMTVTEVFEAIDYEYAI